MLSSFSKPLLSYLHLWLKTSTLQWTLFAFINQLELEPPSATKQLVFMIPVPLCLLNAPHNILSKMMHWSMWKLWRLWILSVLTREVLSWNNSLLEMTLIVFKMCAHAIEAEELVSDSTIEHFKLKSLKADHVKHDVEDDRHDRHNSDDDNDDDDHLSLLSDLLHEWRCERSMKRGSLNLTQCITTERLLDRSGLDGGFGMADAEAKIVTLKPDNSSGESFIPEKFSFLLEILKLLTKIRQGNWSNSMMMMTHTSLHLVQTTKVLTAPFWVVHLTRPLLSVTFLMRSLWVVSTLMQHLLMTFLLMSIIRALMKKESAWSSRHSHDLWRIKGSSGLSQSANLWQKHSITTPQSKCHWLLLTTSTTFSLSMIGSFTETRPDRPVRADSKDHSLHVLVSHTQAASSPLLMLLCCLQARLANLVP